MRGGGGGGGEGGIRVTSPERGQLGEKWRERGRRLGCQFVVHSVRLICSWKRKAKYAFRFPLSIEC